MSKRGSILIVTLWIITILALLAIGVGFRMGLEVKLTGFNVNELKAFYLAKAGITKAVSLRWQDMLDGKSQGIDALGMAWANDKEGFKDIELGEGEFTVSYQSKDPDRSKKMLTLYGMEDEYARLNINNTDMAGAIKFLLIESGLELEDANVIADSIADWRDKDSIPSLNGAEEAYYQALPKPYHAGDTDFHSEYELLLVRGMTPKLFDDIKQYITVFGEGKININTAPEIVLRSVFGTGFPELGEKIVTYRNGFDGKPGTHDDSWFAKGGYVIEREGLGLVNIKDLNDASWSGNIFGITTREWNKLKELAKAGTLVTTSELYRINGVGRIKNIEKRITAVCRFERPEPVEQIGFDRTLPPPEVKYLHWHEE